MKEFIEKSSLKKLVLYSLLFIWALFLFQDISFAWDLTAQQIAEKAKTTSLTDVQGWIDILNWWLKIVSILTWFCTAIVTIFLEPGWYNGDVFGLRDYLKTIWILVSNLVYFAFAFILIWIAFMNIIWKTDEHYELKKALPKFIVWILIVPFSWFFVQFMLSISAILTVAVLTLPYDTFNWFTDFSPSITNYKVCTKYEITIAKAS